MYLEHIKNLDSFNFYGANNLELIDKIKEYLRGNIPPSYYQYLVEIGSGGIAIFDIYGTGVHPSKIPDIVIQNNLYHSTDLNLPKEYLFLMDLGEDVDYYLDLSSRRQDGECKVVGWIEGLTKEEQPEWVKQEESYDTFYEFFKKQVIENKDLHVF